MRGKTKLTLWQEERAALLLLCPPPGVAREDNREDKAKAQKLVYRMRNKRYT
jgi:hypothetical protein